LRAELDLTSPRSHGVNPAPNISFLLKLFLLSDTCNLLFFCLFILPIQLNVTKMNLQLIQHRIYSARNQNVILDFDLAILYEVETKRLNEAVKRNSLRFPEKFMFRLTQVEWQEMRSQIAIPFKTLN
jgi:hypothetical protein